MKVKDDRIQEKLQNEAKIKKIDKNFDGTFLSTILFVMICMGIAWKAFRWGMMESIMDILYIFVEFIFNVYFWKIILGLFIMLIIKLKWRRFAIMFLCGAFLFLPWDIWYEDIRFYLLKDQMEQVAEQIIEDNAYLGKSNFMIALVPYKKYLSRGGEVFYLEDEEMIKIKFYQYRGGENCSNYIYVKKLIEDEPIHLYHISEPWDKTLIAMGENWYYASDCGDKHSYKYSPSLFIDSENILK